MIHRTLESLSAILEYPGAGYNELVGSCCLAVGESLNGDNRKVISGGLDKFRDGISERSREELEELYTRTFDLNPVCSLDLGWHLYAENYDRGTFLVAMREALRRYGIQETQELPDHLPSVLKLLARMPEEEGSALVRDSVLPALRKMIGGFSEPENPYSSLIKAVEAVLVDAYPQEIRSIKP